MPEVEEVDANSELSADVELMEVAYFPWLRLR
jgi:hypothetical protein